MIDLGHILPSCVSMKNREFVHPLVEKDLHAKQNAVAGREDSQ